jgi:site-specific DNA recombinase
VCIASSARRLARARQAARPRDRRSVPESRFPHTVAAAASSTCTTVISLPWSVPAFSSVKGVLHQPEAKPTLKQETREAILLAIAKARSWIDDIASGCVRSLAEIAEREGKVERHIRLLTPLAFIPPRTLAAIIDGTGPHDATVTALAQAVPYRWGRTPAANIRSNDAATAVDD